MGFVQGTLTSPLHAAVMDNTLYNADVTALDGSATGGQQDAPFVPYPISSGRYRFMHVVSPGFAHPFSASGSSSATPATQVASSVVGCWRAFPPVLLRFKRRALVVVVLRPAADGDGGFATAGPNAAYVHAEFHIPYCLLEAVCIVAGDTCGMDFDISGPTTLSTFVAAARVSDESIEGQHRLPPPTLALMDALTRPGFSSQPPYVLFERRASAAHHRTAGTGGTSTAHPAASAAVAPAAPYSVVPVAVRFIVAPSAVAVRSLTINFSDRFIAAKVAKAAATRAASAREASFRQPFVSALLLE
jgi:hypothetical protein